MWIRRIVAEEIYSLFHSGKALIIFGPRQVGKTSLVTRLINSIDDVAWLNCDEPDVRNLLTDVTSTQLYLARKQEVNTKEIDYFSRHDEDGSY